MLLRQKSENLWIIRSGALRELFDLQFRSIQQALRVCALQVSTEARVLDFGSGDAPYDELFELSKRPLRVDAFHPEADYRKISDLPRSEFFDVILAIEVFEHIEEPEKVLKQLGEKLKKDGEIYLSVPFAARIHPDPKDFRRWTPEGLELLAAAAGLEILELQYRGSDLASLLQKTLYYLFRRVDKPWVFVLGIWMAPVLLLAWLSVVLRESMNRSQAVEDPLGFFLRLKRK